MILHRFLALAAILATASPPTAWAADEYHFHLHGGFFYGPGPVKPDTALPDGDINGISFDRAAWRGVATFRAASAPLSDGKTLVNANINAGRLGIGEAAQAKTFLLTAVDGGPNHGTETYTLDDARNFLWNVDLALDPGFAEGIIRVDGFQLTTGWVRVPRSIQAARNIPGGYDKAGSLASGDVLIGRVGDFDRDGFLDGVLVASANVPMESDMLPGAPVGNVRGFTTDIPVDPVTAAELTLSGVQNMRPVLDQFIAENNLAKLKTLLLDVGDRIDAASLNAEDAFLKSDRARKEQLQPVRWRIEAARQLFFIPWAFLSTYDFATGKVPDSVKDSIRRGFDMLGDVLPKIREIRVSTQEAPK